MALKITEDVLKAMVSLNSENNANWIKIKEWIAEEFRRHQASVALGIQLTDVWIRASQGMSIILFELSTYMENPKEELEIILSRPERRDKPIQGVI